MQNVVPDFPTPIIGRPKRRRVVPARVDEFQILLIGYFVLVNGKSRDVRRVGLVLVVPTETVAAAFKPQRGYQSSAALPGVPHELQEPLPALFDRAAIGAACKPASPRA